MIQTAITPLDSTSGSRRWQRRAAPRAAGDQIMSSLARRTAGGRTSRRGLDVEARLVEQAPPLGRARASARLERRRRVSPSARTACSVRVASSQSARSKIPGSRSSQRPCVSSMSSRLGAKTSKTKRPPGSSSAARGAQRAELLGLVCMCRSERNGQMTSGTRSATGGSRRSPTRRSTSARDAALARAQRARDGEHPGRRVDADHRDARPARSARRSGPSRRRARRPGRRDARASLDVEADVLDDRAAPRVVDRRDASRRAPRRAVVGPASLRGPRAPLVRSTPSWTPTALEREGARRRSGRVARRTRSRRVRVEYLGRKSELKLALREVRDRETGMALNARPRAARGGDRRARGGARAGRARRAG